MNHNMRFGTYYQAEVDPLLTWYFVAILRSFEHIAFDRTKDAQTGTFEFFVPHDTESFFIDIMHHFEQESIVHNLRKLSNRLVEEQL